MITKEFALNVWDGDKDNELKYGTLNLKAVREACVRMIIIDELPFRHVEKEGFKDFVKVACPRFTIPSRFTIARDCLQLYYGKEKGMQLANNVKAYAYELFDEYRIMYSSQVAQAPPSGDSMSLDLEDDGNVSGGVDYMRSVRDRAKRMTGSSGYVNSEFDRYINEQLGAEEEDMDPLAWWGSNEHRYPIVSRLARYILAIPFSTVASESAFSAGGRHLDPFRISLTPKMVQALICTQDWLRARKGASGVKVEENLKDLEEIEKGTLCFEEEEDEHIIFRHLVN